MRRPHPKHKGFLCELEPNTPNHSGPCAAFVDSAHYRATGELIGRSKHRPLLVWGSVVIDEVPA